MRPRVSVFSPPRLRQEPTFHERNMDNFTSILNKMHIPIHETETGPSEIETKMRQDQDKIVSNFVLHDKAIIFNFIHDRDKTKSLGTLSK